jgi:rhomboid-like protein
MFSHQQVRHLVLNMAVLWIAGTRVHEEIGRGGFLGIYFASGALGSMTSLAASVFRNQLTTSSLGASGAVAGILAAWFSLHADEGFKVLFVPDEWLPRLSGLGVLATLVGIEVVGVWRRWRRVDHWAHLGGYAGGVFGAKMVAGGRRRKREEERRRREKEKERGWLNRVREGRW